LRAHGGREARAQRSDGGAVDVRVGDGGRVEQAAAVVRARRHALQHAVRLHAVRRGQQRLRACMRTAPLSASSPAKNPVGTAASRGAMPWSKL
jgi:7-keto-8-aminopelargonate synthetase-like enzyme